MLGPDYILHLSEKAEAISELLHNAIVSRIVARFIRQMERYEDLSLGSAARWQLKVLQEAGYLYEDVQKEIASKTKLEFSAIKQAFESAGLESYNYDSEVYRKAGISSPPLNKSPFYLRLLQRNNEATNGEWYNYTRTTADQAQVDFIQACDNAYNLVSTGTVSYSDAVSEAVNSIGSKGVVVTYPSGHTDTLETATLRAVRTGTAQACAAITDARMDEYNWDIILVSAHLGARVTDKEDFTNHAWWQGKFYSKSGRDPKFPPFSVCGKGDVQGISGANCRHSYGPGDGVFNPYEKFDSEENKKAYELSQKQRAKERAIRKSKRELMALKTGVEECKDPETAEKLKSLYDRKKDVLNRQFSQYNSFCKENGLKPLYDRTEVAGYTKKAPKVEIKNPTPLRESESASGFSTVSEIKAFSNEANTFLNDYCDKKSLWSGNTIVDNSINAFGMKEWSCDLRVRSDCGKITIIHELLHARSSSYYKDTDLYLRWQNLEEGSVELFSQEICSLKGIPFAPTYRVQVDHLRFLRDVFEKEQFSFAKELFNTDLPLRFDYLENLFENYKLLNPRASIDSLEAIQNAIDYFY